VGIAPRGCVTAARGDAAAIALIDNNGGFAKTGRVLADGKQNLT